MAQKRSKQRREKSSPPTSDAKKESAAPVGQKRFPDWLTEERIALFVIFGLALLLRTLNLIEMKRHSPFYDMPSTDSALFDKMAMAIAKGDWLGKEVFFYNPFYTYLLSLFYTLFGHSYTVVKVFQALIGSLTPVLVYFIAKRIAHPKVGLIAGFITAAYGLFIFHDELLLVESLTNFLILLATLLLFRIEDRPTFLRFLVGGLGLGIAFVSRPTVLPFVGFIWLVFVFRKERWAFLIPRLAVFGFAALLMVLPVTIRNYIVGDDIVLVSAHTGYNFYLGNNPEANGYLIMPTSASRTQTDSPTDQRDYFTTMAEKDLKTKLKPSQVSRYWTGKGIDFIVNHSWDWVKILGQKFIRIVNEFEFSDNQSFYFSEQYSYVLRLPLFSFGFVSPLALLGLVLFARDWRKLFFLYLFVIGYAGSLMVYFTGSRYRMLCVPFLIIFAAMALHWLFEAVKKRRYFPLVQSGVLLAFFIYLAFLEIPGASRNPHFVDYYNVGNKYLHKYRFKEAVESFEKSIAINPGYLSSRNNLASAYEQTGQWDKAREQWRALLVLGKRQKSPLHVERAEKHLKKLNRHIQN